MNPIPSPVSWYGLIKTMKQKQHTHKQSHGYDSCWTIVQYIQTEKPDLIRLNDEFKWLSHQKPTEK